MGVLRIGNKTSGECLRMRVEERDICTVLLPKNFKKNRSYEISDDSLRMIVFG